MLKITFLLLGVFLLLNDSFGGVEDTNARLEAEQKRLDQLLHKYTPYHPDVIILKRKIAELKELQKRAQANAPHEAKPPPSKSRSASPKQPRNFNVFKEKIRTEKITRPQRAAKNAPKPIAKFEPIRLENPLRAPLLIKETAGVGAQAYPVNTIVPLPYGKYQNTDAFRITDSGGKAVPAQFDVLNRWWYKDNSIRHLSVKFQPSVAPFAGPGSGISIYYLKDDKKSSYTGTSSPLKIQETKNMITVETGPLKFTVNKKNFNLLDQVWFDRNQNHVIEEEETVIAPHLKNGGVFTGRLPGDVQFDSARKDIVFDIEEKGPMRAVIRAEAVTHYFNPKNHQHGFAVRIYAYAGKPFIKIEYQLQNSAKNKVFSWPLYFEHSDVDFRLNLKANPTVKFGLSNGNVYERAAQGGLYLAQKRHNKFEIKDLKTDDTLSSGKRTAGFMDVSDGQKGVTAMLRYFWQTWPNGLKIDEENKLSLQLFPEWSAQWRQREGIKPHFTKTGLYWLQDMQHVYKEMLLFFHGSDIQNSDLTHLAQTFQHHPVGVLPTQWYKETAVTLDLDGMIPIDSRIGPIDQRIPSYKGYDFNIQSSTQYHFGWNQFYGDVHRKWGASQGGGWPYSLSAFIATENPGDYFHAERFALGELNMRPQWLAQYDFAKDWRLLQLTENPYAGVSWRKIKGGRYKRHFDAPFLKGTDIDAKPRDDEHAWFYHMEEAYYLTGNLWIKDWYEFIREFRKTRLNHLDPYTDPTTRATAHALAHALQAYRVTGDTSIIEGFRKYLNQWLRKEQNPYHGAVHPRSDRSAWVGYLSRTLIGFMQEVKGKNWQAYAEAFNYLSGLMEWNYHYSNFGYQVNADRNEKDSSSMGGQNMADPQAWYYWHTGKRKYLEHLNRYLYQGINQKGQKAYPAILQWTDGRFQGRYVQFVRENKKEDNTPPAAVDDLKAVLDGRSLLLTWTAPEKARRYHIVWSDKPISEETTRDKKFTNWWAAHPVGPDLPPQPRQKQTLKIQIPQRSARQETLYAAVFTFDEHHNMSAMSNLAATHR